MKSGIFGIILASKAKQELCNLYSETYRNELLYKTNSVFQACFTSLLDTIDDKNIITITNTKLFPEIKKQSEILRERFCRSSDYTILTEPIPKGTASASAIGIKYVLDNKISDNDIVVILNANFYVKNKQKYSKSLDTAINIANKDFLTIFGTTLNLDNCNGECLKVKNDENQPELLRLIDFKESCSFRDIKKFIKNKNYYQNTGIIVAKVKLLEKLYENFYSKKANPLKGLNVIRDIPSVEYRSYEKFDYTSLEKVIFCESQNIAVLEENFGWNNININNFLTNKKTPNVLQDDSCKNSVFYSDTKPIAVGGIKDTVVIDTKESLLIYAKSKQQEVFELCKKINSNPDLCKTVYRPWGYYTQIDKSQGSLIKYLVVNPKGQLSIQKHKHRAEHWFVIEGKAEALLNGKKYILSVGSSLNIGKNEIHSLLNPFNSQIKILEIQVGDILDENDIERLDDIYGRV